MVMQGVTWYGRDANGMVIRQLRSPRATWANPGWKLETPQGFDVKTITTQKILPATIVAKGIDPAQTFIDRQAHQLRRLPPW